MSEPSPSSPPHGAPRLTLQGILTRYFKEREPARLVVDGVVLIVISIVMGWAFYRFLGGGYFHPSAVELRPDLLDLIRLIANIMLSVFWDVGIILCAWGGVRELGRLIGQRPAA